MYLSKRGVLARPAAGESGSYDCIDEDSEAAERFEHPQDTTMRVVCDSG